MKKGFTLVELMVVIILIGIITTISVSSFSYMRSVSQFRGDTDLLFQSILDARTNAIGQKKCPSGGESYAWIFELDNSTATPTAKIICQTAAGIDDLKTIDIPFSLFIKPATVNPITVTGATDTPTKVRIIFLSDILDTRIGWTKDITFNETTGTDVKMTFQNATTGTNPETSTICFNKTQGFPTINKKGTTCIPF